MIYYSVCYGFYGYFYAIIKILDPKASLPNSIKNLFELSHNQGQKALTRLKLAKLPLIKLYN